MTILVVNAGSSSLKFQLFAIGDDDALERRLKGQLEGIGTRPRLTAVGEDSRRLVDEIYAAGDLADLPAALDRLAAWLRPQLGGETPRAVGHRVVHGGPSYAAPVAVDEAVLAALDAFVPLAPLHQPNNLLPIRLLRERRPDLLQVACFDTAFHRTHPELADRFALPEALYDAGIRRYGFHGLSYEYIAGRLPEVAPGLARGRVVVAHLGSGASACAMVAGRSVDSTMGFTALDGLPMGTRPGQLDPGVVLYLMAQRGMSAAEIEHLLYHDCGLKGLSGISNDVRDLLASEAPAARLALDYFVYRTAREIAALAAAMGGIDGLVFTAGIGENAGQIRAWIGERCAWLGAAIDAARNRANGPLISTDASRLPVLVIPTDEERMIADHTLAVLRAQPPGRPEDTR